MENAKTACYYCHEQCNTLQSLGEHLISKHTNGEPVDSIRGGVDSGLIPFLRARKEKESNKCLLKDAIQTIPRTVKTPLPHQAEAIDAILSEFKDHDRATIVMACGSGKTLVAMWTFMKLSGKRALVLVPSLSLLRQTLLEWKAHEAFEAVICVCSDPTVQEDEVHVSPKDLGYPVSTTPTEIRVALTDSRDKKTAVFCTYHSAHLLGKALTDDFRFDLAVFDEAHKTCGPKEARFAFGLANSEIKASKRLFMTATPKIRLKRGSPDKAESSYSMDDSSTYGQRVYSLTLRDAIDRAIICDYKVVIIVVTHEEIAKGLERKSSVRFPNAARSIIDVAYAIGFAKALDECGAKKAITFHASVANAQQLTWDTWWKREGMKHQVFHVNGAMKTTERETVIEEFSRSERSIISNARCLTEGVDVPVVDMVAFLSHRKSRIDITQAIGRALRRSPGKLLGHVMLPIILTADGTPIKGAGYSDLSDVLWTLREQDSILDEKIRMVALNRGVGLKSDESLGGKVAVYGPTILPEQVRESIKIEILSSQADSWDEMFGRLMAYRKKTGSCMVPHDYTDIKLANWVNRQRDAYRNGTLGADRTTLLESVGFYWNAHDGKFEGRLRDLIEWKKKTGSWEVPASEIELTHFICSQRIKMRQQRLDKERVDALNAIGFPWDPREQTWLEHFENLKAFQEKHGHLVVPRSSEYIYLHAWVRNQRLAKRQGILDDKKIHMLEALGFKFDSEASLRSQNADLSLYENIWNSRFEELKEWKRRTGSSHVAAKENKELAQWVTEQRVSRKNGTLKKHRLEALESIGFVWDRQEDKWEQSFRKLSDFKNTFGHFHLNRKNKLAGWVTSQRELRQKGKLEQSRIDRLDSIGFEWSVRLNYSDLEKLPLEPNI